MAERIVSEISGRDENQDAVFYKLESLGYRVGQGLTERWARLTIHFNVLDLFSLALLLRLYVCVWMLLLHVHILFPFFGLTLTAPIDSLGISLALQTT